MIDLWKVVLPQSRAFSLIINKTMRRFFGGLCYPQDFRDESDRMYKQLDPQVTDALLKWESQFYLPDTGLTEQQRRDRLEATWKMTGGQSPAYLQSILRGYGFDVYVHDWWMPAGNKNLTMGSSVSFMGGEFSFMGQLFDNYPSPWDPNLILIPPYYPLVNKIASQVFAPITMGSGSAYMGNAFMGDVIDTEFTPDYPIPSNPDKWRYFCYVGGEEMPNQATVPLSRKNEFEELILAIFPAQLWVGIIVEYV